MDIQPTIKEFNILPVLCLKKHINPLSPQAKIDFNSTWDYYFTGKIAWLIWEINL